MNINIGQKIYLKEEFLKNIGIESCSSPVKILGLTDFAVLIKDMSSNKTYTISTQNYVNNFLRIDREKLTTQPTTVNTTDGVTTISTTGTSSATVLSSNISSLVVNPIVKPTPVDIYG